MNKLYSFDTSLVMRNTYGKNAYGLVNKYGEDLTRKETIEYFDKLKVTDNELEDLNDYIREDRERHTIYDDCWMVSGSVGGCNYIEGKRFWNNLIKNMTRRENNFNAEQDIPEFTGPVYTFTCQYEESIWTGKIINIINHSGYLEFTVTGRGSSIKTYIGDSGSELWACFPVFNRGCSLARADDTFWNKEKLFQLFESIPDSITVAGAIKALSNLIDATKI